MKHYTPQRRWAMVALAAISMAGCVNKPPQLYEWGGYQTLVYDHLRSQGKGPEQQILDMESDRERANSKGLSVPPGYYGHLGLLYLSIGKNDMAVMAWNKEKSLFPESGQYVDFLINNMKKQGG